MTALKCQFCNSELIDDTTTVKVNINGKSVHIQNIPAQICSNHFCDQELLIGLTVQTLEDIVTKAIKDNIDLGRAFDFRQSNDFLANVMEYAR
jgi:YgiT-type zinc finger domain-containing protein